MKHITLTRQMAYAILPDRIPESHKGTYGKVLLLCGSRGYTGAAALAAMGALRSGAGLVYLGVPECIYAIEAVKLLEPVVFPLPDEEGMLAESCMELVLAMLPKMDAVLIGPGLGRSDAVVRIVKTVLGAYTGPVVLDADGINAMKSHMDIVRDRTGITVLTPHMGEFQNVYGPVNDRESAAVEFAATWNCILVLKGNHTIVTDGASIYRNPTGNPGMAVGGCGDILAGIIVSMIGQGVDPLSAAACGVYFHGLAGDVCAENIGQYGMLPSDMLEVLPRLLK